MTKQSTEITEPSLSAAIPRLRATRIFVLLFLTLHALAAIGVWRLMPGGFPIGHPRLWANRVLPTVVVAYAMAGLLLAIRRQWRWTALLLIASPIAWLAAAGCGAVAFPISGRYPSLAVAVVAVVVLLAIRRHLLAVWPTRRQMLITPVAPLLVGLALPLSQLAPPTDTRPIAGVTPPMSMVPLAHHVPTQKLVDGVRVVPSTGQVMTDRNGRSIWVQPLLTFISRSPDRCWTNLAPRFDRLGPPRRLAKYLRADADVMLDYLDDGYSRLRVRDDVGVIDIDAGSSLPQAIYSHLNSYVEITVHGHRRLAIAFSPDPNAQIDVTYSEYPVGRPMRAGYLGGDGVFRVVEASSGEKGPFHQLASGKLGREDPFTLTLLDDGTPFARITLADFAKQAGVQLSPTGGWGFPVNAIEFTLTGERDISPASIYVSLASTSVGRGWDSVGHTAGTYRNRMRVEYLKP